MPIVPLTLTRKKENKKESTTTEEHNRIKALEKQVRSLQIENAFLKELRKLRKQEVKATYMYWQKRFDRLNPDQEIEEKVLEIRREHKYYGCLRQKN